jgi:four helix bundle protein
MSHSHTNLIAWQKAKALAVEIYRVTDRFPRSELYGLTSQLRRAAVSVASNIAEGQGRVTKGEFVQFLGHARGSILEIETQLAIAVDLGYVSPQQYQRCCDKTAEVLRLTNGLLDYLRPRAKVASA